MADGRRVAGAIKSLVNVRNLQIECVRVLHETLLVPVLTYGSEKMLWKDKERSIIRAAQIDILRGLLIIRRMDIVPNARIREFCGVTKGVETKGLMRVFSGGLAMWRGWRRNGLLRESM